jgi:hypothetical protein
MGYTYRQEGSARAAVLLSSAIHSLAHTIAVVGFALFFMHWNDRFEVSGNWYELWEWLGILLVEMGLIGFFVGSTIFGLNLLITCRWFRMNYNDAFSALRLGRYNNFLRMRIRGDSLEIYAVGLQDVPRRHEWNANPKHTEGNPEEPVFIPATPLRPHLIEKVTL